MTTRYTALVTTPTTVTTDAPATTGSLRTLGTGNPQNLGVPAPGTATSASASDHVHQMPTAGDVGADPVGAAAAAQAAANAYTDASILAVTVGTGRAKIATAVTVPNLSAVVLNTLDPSVIPVTGDKVLLLGSASPDGVIPATAAYGGLYDVGVVVAGVAPITRNASFNTAAEICGASWFVTDGVYSNDFWACTNDVAITTLNVTPLTFVQFAGALSNNAAQPLGVAASGTSHDVSRADHVHVLPSAGDVGAAPATRNIATTAPLSGGGTLSSDLTLSVATATTLAAGVVQLSSATPQALGVAAAGSTGNASDAGHVHAMPTAADVGAPPTSRTVATTSPLSGGGTLSGDLNLSLTLASGSGLEDSSGLRIASSAAGTGLTGGGGSALAVSFGSTSTTACVGNDARLSDARTPTSHAASHGSAGSDPITIASTQVTGLGTASGLNVGTTAGTVAAGDDSRIVNAVPNTRTVAGLALSADISVAALNTALGSNSSLGVRTLIADTGWTNTTSGTASITRVAGVHTFNVNANGFAIERRATISTAECPAIEVLGRINVTTGTPASGWYSSISLANTADTFGFIAQVHESQKLGLYQNNGAGWTQVALSAGIFSLGSGIWIRLVVTPSYASCGWLATGTNTPPPAGSEWNLGGTVATTIGTLAQSYLNQVGVRSGRPNTGSGTYTTEWTQLQWRILGVAP